MRKRVKGFIVGPIVIGLICVAVGFVGGAGCMWYYMSTHQGGLGDAQDAGLPEEMAVSETLTPDEELTEPPTTEPVTENLSYIKVIVSGNDYVYKGEVFRLQEILAIIRTNPGLPVRISDDGASLRAYDSLIDALDEMGAEYVESSTS